MSVRKFGWSIAAWLLIGLMCAACAQTGRRDILWDIVHNCLDERASGACRAPRQAPLSAQRFDSAEQARAYCRSGTDVWGEERGRFVALRDIKMCACPLNTSFIHGLALPYERVRGVEAVNRPEGIFAFAWNIGIARLGAAEASNLALAVNPTGLRSQDQLHVHIVRLRADFQQRIAAQPAKVLRSVHLDDLSAVWRHAPPPGGGINDFGVLITADPAGGYLLRFTDPGISPEDEYTQYGCG